jgi:hypothetical protein
MDRLIATKSRHVGFSFRELAESHRKLLGQLGPRWKTLTSRTGTLD